jgi:hypothetical protein
MKKIITLMVIALVSLTVFAGPKDKYQYIITNQGVINCSNIKLGLNKLTITMLNGDKKTFTTQEIEAFYRNGKLYEIRPFVLDGKATSKKVWMELIKTKYALRVYKLSKYNENTGSIVDRYMVYNNEGFIVEINNKNKETLMPFLGLTVKKE